jgi:type I restriction enzyme S subunit
MQNNNLPDWWKIVKLKDYTIERKQKNKANEELTVFSISNKRWFVKSDDYFEWQVYSKDLKNYKIVKKWEFWFSPPRINVWSIAYMEEYEIWVISPIYVVFALKDWIDVKFFKYFMKGHLFNKQVNNFTQWAVRQNLSYDDFWKIELLLPPLEVQQEIAWNLNDLDKLIETQNNQIDKYEKLKKAMMRKLFSEWIWHTEFKDSKLWRIPKDWEVNKLGNLIKKYQYWLSYSMNEDWIWKKIVKMDNLKKWRINYDNLKYVEITDEEFKKFKLEKWDLLINRTNSLELVWRSWIVHENDDVVFASYLIRIFLDTNLLNNKYTNYYFAYILKYIQNLSTQWVSQANINTWALNIIPIKKPNLIEQEKIADILENIDNLFEKEREIKEGYEKVKKWIVSLVFSCNLLIK